NFNYSGQLLDNGATKALALTKSGTGTQTLSGLTGYFGGTTVSGGTLQAGIANAFSPNSSFTVNATLNLGGFNQSIRSLHGAGTVTTTGTTSGATLTIGNDHLSTSFSGILQNASGGRTLGLIKNGTGTQTLSGANTYSGATTLNTGTLKAGAANAFSPN